MDKKVILHLCAYIGSDSRYYDIDDNYTVIKIGKDIGVENYSPDQQIHGVIANPVCTEFSILKGFDHTGDIEKGMILVRECQRIIKESNPKWWVIENPAKGRLKEILGVPDMVYQPWQFGSPWTKKTALWGDFRKPLPTYIKWGALKKLPLYKRPGRDKPNLAYLHKSAIHLIPEFSFAKEFIKTDSDLRSMCSQGFAKAFYLSNP